MVFRNAALLPVLLVCCLCCCRCPSPGGSRADDGDWQAAWHDTWKQEQEQHGQQIVRDLQTLIGFRTCEHPGSQNWDAPEFRRQREFLRARATRLGLAFKSYDGRMEEITLPGPDRAPVLALLTHGDVQPVEGQAWNWPPWEGRIANGRIYGRGAEDDKASIIAALYDLGALRASGRRLKRTVRLLVANGEESSWDEIDYYRQRAAAMPDMTIGLDAAYPVTTAQKAFGVINLIGPSSTGNKPGDWRILSLAGGSQLTSVPDHAEAILEGRNYGELAASAARWSEMHPGSRLRVERQGGDDGRVRVEAFGKSAHSSEPEIGHNALGDMVAFLSSGLSLAESPLSALVRFAGETIGVQTQGESLGIAHTDAMMGPLTVNLAIISQDEAGRPRAEINIRIPRGITDREITAALAQKAGEFEHRTAQRIEVQTQFYSPPHVVPEDSPLVRSLLEVWRADTGRNGRPVSIGGGTQASQFPNGVDFGPVLSMKESRAHGADEYVTVEELMRTARLTLGAILRLAL